MHEQHLQVDVLANNNAINACNMAEDPSMAPFAHFIPLQFCCGAIKTYLVVSNILYFHPPFGEMFQFDEHIF